MAKAQDTLKVGNTTAPIVSKGMGKQETLGGSASQEYTVGKYFVGDDGYYYLVSQTIAQGGTITVGTNCTKTDLAAELVGKAPTNHKSAQTTYGVGDANNYGHVKVDASPTANSTNALQSGGAKTALDGKAPTSHASSDTTYGVGSTTNYGHVKVDDALSASSTNPVQNKKVKAAVDEVKQALSNGLGGYIDKCGVKNLSSYVGTFVGKTYATNANEYKFGSLYLKQGEKIVYTCNQDSALVSNTRNTLVIAPPNTAPTQYIFEDGNAGGTTNHHLEAGLHIIEYTATSDGEYNFYFWPHTLSSAITYSKFMICTADAYAYDSSYVQPATKNIDALSADVNAELGAHNFLNHPSGAQTHNGVTYTPQSDFSILVNGTAEGSSYYNDASLKTQNLGGYYFTLKAGTYVLSSGFDSLPAGIAYIYIAKATNDQTFAYIAAGQGDKTFTVSEETQFVFRIQIGTGVTVSNVTVKPLIKLPSDPSNDITPYAMTNQQLTDVAVQTQGGFILEKRVAGTDYIAVSADGVKTYAQLAQELTLAYIAKAQSLANGEYIELLNVGCEPHGTFSIAGNQVGTMFDNSQGNAAGFLFSNAIDQSIWSMQIHTTLSANYIKNIKFNTNSVTITDRTSDVPTAQTNIMKLFYRLWRKIS